MLQAGKRLEILHENVECPICRELAIGAYELKCCGNIIWTKCSTKVQRQSTCSFCRSAPVSLSECRPIRRIIDTLETTCGVCESRVTYGQMEAHRVSVCPKRKVRCSYGECQIECQVSEFRDHVLVAHFDDFVAELLQVPRVPIDDPFGESIASRYKPVVLD
jgi:hypothetical protein